MPGEFSKANRPRRPGAYFDFDARQAVPPPPGLGGIVAVAFVNDWGPVDTPVLLRSFGDFKTWFSDSINTQAYRSVRQAFQGEGTPGNSGAAAVLAYRMAGSAALTASKTLQNTAPAAAITLTAKYAGTRGNLLNVTVQDLAGVQTPEQDELIIYDGATEVERYSYTDTDITALAALINQRSKWVTAGGVTTGTALTNVANQSLTAGNDGNTLLAQDYTDMMSGLETQRFSILTFEAPTADAGIMTSLKVWTQNARKNGKRFRVVIGGLLNETATTAITRSISFNDEGFVNLGVGSVTDELLGQLSTGMAAPRVAGVLAARGETASLTYARFAGWTLNTGPTDSEILACFDGGVTVLARDSNIDAPVRVEKGLTTYTTTTNADKPYLIFRDPKFIATMDGIQMECQEFGEQEVVGKMPVNASTKSFCRARIGQMLQRRQDAGIVQPGWDVSEDNDPPPTPQDDFLQFLLAFTFGRTTEQIYFTASVS